MYYSTSPQQLRDVFENAAPVWGTYLNNVFDLVDVKYQTNHAGDVFDKARSDQAKNARGD